MIHDYHWRRGKRRKLIVMMETRMMIIMMTIKPPHDIYREQQNHHDDETKRSTKHCVTATHPWPRPAASCFRCPLRGGHHRRRPACALPHGWSVMNSCS
ncbi:HCMVUL109 [Human betaherpesvirus 5]|uniref:Uncharacterized protein UL109 n=1 Tax=Human cytomegalovirus (strain AD169) TaxID=10360 RepID=UL109_HCMVA|nr:RecName: Full=Uncharacterized protein UL109 [Human herpesvirus 5 strain AD169]CAA35347.1 HCMVUL109 [Human betaherpesvirus 5]